ncbi:hypothetical protein [Clostridium sp. CF012]|uniref:hypothetical protein n=1 Tax=Clostridium sp. CF012 TaxID=2843319 RepID=UPI001C0A9A75|nr:hypothetical protein [Clostridium sp. CF012]MBU3142602.1 hypothetical protein [Clostridium sp. CF012]
MENNLEYIDLSINENIINPRLYGFVGDGIFNDSIALDNMFLNISEGSTVRFPMNSIVRLESDVITNKSCNIDFQNSTILSYCDNGLKFSGTLKNTFSVVEDYVEIANKNTLTLNSVIGIEVGDLISVISSELYDTSRLYYFKGGNAIITKVVGNIVYFNIIFPFDMLAGSITVSIYEPIIVKIKNIKLLEGKKDLSLSIAGLSIEYGKNICLEYINTRGFHANISLKRCVNSKLDFINTGNAKNINTDPWDGYGICIYSCNNLRGNNIMTNSGQHGLTWGGQEVNYGLHFEDCIFKSEVTTYGVGAHENLHDAIFINVKIFGASLSNNINCINCEFVSSELGNVAVLLFCAENPRRANYKFSKCNFSNLTIVLADYYQVVCPTRKYVGNIVLEDCENFSMLIKVNAQTTGGKIAEIGRIAFNRVKNYSFNCTDILGYLEIKNSDSEKDGGIITQAAVNSTYQKIKNVYLENISICRGYDNVYFGNCDSVVIKGFSYNALDRTNGQETFANVGKLYLENYVNSSAPRGIRLTSIGELMMINCEIKLLCVLATALANVVRAEAKGLKIGNEYMDIITSTSNKKYKLQVNSNGAQTLLLT